MRRIDPLSAVKKRSCMARVPCVTRPARFPVLDWKKHTPLESPHVPCLRLIDRAGGPPLRHQGRGWQSMPKHPGWSTSSGFGRPLAC